ncbi:TonB-dependent receptor [Lysobacter helvus]|uniref:TonB-dependent receptor n=2 Tax=Lysobacteraceae TaxID=32033 RepID=A0ABN6FRI1_9GAMM|nr:MULTISPECIES: TonB-dependent receptor [Lysobacter]BCT92056.1 TonB-dependent receptor [Lysobacter caseinilyticus]BCT95209.1 TonB-dependent receptor [Lysobacter helvus]
MTRAGRARLPAGALLFACPLAAFAQATTAPTPAMLDTVVVTATKRAERSFDVPASIDVVDGATIRDGQPGINLSEPLVRVSGVFAANRNNYAQDIQVSSRGYGGRATFGVRGVRLYQDFIPATMPDGQGQTGSFSLLSAKSIEVLRGPFSTLYGNASGGVISVFTEDPGASPVAGFALSAGSDATYNAELKANGTAGKLGYVVAANHFDTDGYREHSAATRDVVNAKFTFAPSARTRITVIGSSQHQPESQDPLGLTQAQVDADPRQATSVATLFDTRKSVDMVQGGVALEQDLPGDGMLRVTGYDGRREIRQFLALTGVGATSSGGVVDLDRDFGGLGARLILRGALADRPWVLTLGVDADRMRETRLGFVNNFGVQGELRRNEDDTVKSTDAYAELTWDALHALSLTLGLRTSRVDYDSEDHYIVGANPDDSGSRTYRDTSPIAGLVWHASDTLNVYASYGQGFETPTLAELAYRPTGAGLNLGLDSATSTSLEAGIKWLPTATQRLNLAVFGADTDQEIVVDTATGGRTTYRNAGKTRRRGFEAAWDADFGTHFNLHANYSWLDATFSESFSTGSPPVVVPAGTRLPGVPPKQAFGVVTWTPGGWAGFSAAAEVQYVGRLQANDRNTDAAPAYTLGNLRVGFAQTAGKWTWREYVRVDNIADVGYIGSVIVGDTNGRYFEPAPGRNWFAGVNVALAF